MTETPGLGRIEKVDLREAWSHEANDFTPWLAEHISELGDALGLQLELQSQEAPVGRFSLDLLARDLGTNRTVIIENQLESTNHDHLGKLLTYAGGYDANVVVWITRDFKDEHRQALDWLNQRTDKNTQLMERQESIESKLSEVLKWERGEHMRASRIAALREGSIDDAQETLKEIENWMIGKLLDFQRVFGPILDELTTRVSA